MAPNRFDVLQYLQDKEGLFFGILEAGHEGYMYHIGFVSTGGLRALRFDAIGTITVTIDTNSAEIRPGIHSLAARMGLYVSPEEVDGFLVLMEEAEHRYLTPT